MKKYILFGFDESGSFGGLNDIRGMTNDYAKAVGLIQKTRFDIAYIVDRDTWNILLQKGKKDES